MSSCKNCHVQCCPGCRLINTCRDTSGGSQGYQRCCCFLHHVLNLQCYSMAEKCPIALLHLSSADSYCRICRVTFTPVHKQHTHICFHSIAGNCIQLLSAYTVEHKPNQQVMIMSSTLCYSQCTISIVAGSSLNQLLWRMHAQSVRTLACLAQ